MNTLQILAFLLAGFTFCVEAHKGTLQPYTEAATEGETENTLSYSSELHTQGPATEVNITENYDIFTEASKTNIETTIPRNDTSTNVEVKEDPEGLEVRTLIGIIAGTALMIGFIAIIILLILRKMGRYSRP
ncbi:hypothetical protein XENTR_v10018994 [Xenopus tropicalis]|uniref:Podoplanin isoform X1 n=1 Tax=Xenopus tropicalis TaxID=8364 RepID=A0A8J1JX45_XENTR|nr:podoplanin isoform X1 [Xenopus tropicalis]KAE8593127.1 hypothetical protein XENTR_v10018994 [Xenopus tropicalis]